MRNRSLPEKLSSIAQTASLNLTTLGILLNFMKMRCKGSAAKEPKKRYGILKKWKHCSSTPLSRPSLRSHRPSSRILGNS